jgi:hypothetical protein
LDWNFILQLHRKQNGIDYYLRYSWLLFVAIFFLIKQILKLSENSFKIESTLHKTAQVYLTIPEAKSGKGKVLISINGAIHELDAMTLSTEKLPSTVKVVAVESNLLIVEKLN